MENKLFNEITAYINTLIECMDSIDRHEQTLEYFAADNKHEWFVQYVNAEKQSLKNLIDSAPQIIVSLNRDLELVKRWYQ